MVKEAIMAFLQEEGLMTQDMSNFKVSFDDGREYELVNMMSKFFKENALLQVVSDVKEFCEAGGHSVRVLPEEWDEAERKLKLKLIKEEFEELEEASGENNLTEERDAFGDSIYVLAGHALARGYAGSVSTDWAVIQRSNMSKFCDTEEVARDTVARYKRQLTDCHFEKNEKTGGYTVISDEEATKGKILKSHLYTPAFFSKEVEPLQ